jgi:hypothetical protein
MDEKLKPCPFCGDAYIDPEFWMSERGNLPGCNTCGGSAPTANMWNTRAASQWQPIETAPKDGREILVYCRGYISEGPYTVAFQGKEWRACWGGERVVEYTSECYTEYKEPLYPTHWQPLPDPPTKEEPR